MEAVGDAEVVPEDPLQGVGHHVEEERGRAESKWEALVYEVFALPISA